MNMGIGDGVDLGWRSPRCSRAGADRSSSDSYERERRPVHEYVMDEAVANHALLPKQMWREGLEDATAGREHMRTALGAEIKAAKIREFSTSVWSRATTTAASPIVVDERQCAAGARLPQLRPFGASGLHSAPCVAQPTQPRLY